MALMNYTGREAIDRGLITIVSEKDVLPLTVYLKVDNSLKNNPRYENSNVVLEAVLRTMSQRVDLGAVADLAPSVKVVFKRQKPADSAAKVAYRGNVPHNEKRMSACGGASFLRPDQVSPY